jgi:hypothetical protein
MHMHARPETDDSALRARVARWTASRGPLPDFDFGEVPDREEVPRATALRHGAILASASRAEVARALEAADGREVVLVPIVEPVVAIPAAAHRAARAGLKACAKARQSCPRCHGRGCSPDDFYGTSPGPAAPARTTTSSTPAATSSVLTYTRAVRDYIETGVGVAPSLAGRNRREVVEACEHEAAHALTAIAFGAKLSSVTVVERDGSAGETRATYGDDDAVFLRVALAPERPGDGDLRAADLAAARLAGDAAGRRAEIDAARADVAELFSTLSGRDAHRALSLALLRCGSLTGAEAERITLDCGVRPRAPRVRS